MSMAVIGVTAPGVAATSLHTPSRSKTSLAPWDNASERSLREMLPAGRASSVTTSRSLSDSASASVAPTGPAPTMTRSCNMGLGRCVAATAGSARASGFDVGDGLRRRAGQIFVAGGGYQNIVLDAHAEVPEFFGYFVGRADINAGLDGEDHAGLETARFAVDAVQADIVHVEP